MTRTPRLPLSLQPLAQAALLLCAAGAASAQTTATTTPAATLPAVTVTATLTEQDARTAPASVTIITREELAERNASDLLDAVRGAPGITLQARQVGGRKTIALRGLEGKHTLTLIDGRRISASDDVIGHSDYQYGWLPVSAIERVEIIRGPMSALYGSEALGGVVNIITRQSKDRWVGSVGASAAFPTSSGDAAREGGVSVFAAGPVTDRLRLAINAEGAHRAALAEREDPRYSEIEGRDPRSVGVTATFDLAAGHQLEAGITDGKEKRLYDDVSGTTAYQNRYDIDRQQAHVGWKGDFGGWKAQARAYQSEMNVRNSRTRNVAATRPQDMRDQVVDGHASTQWGAHRVTLGGEWRNEELVNAGLKNGRDDATHQALFVQDEFALAPSLLATLGLRTDRHELFGSEASPRAYLVWEASPTLVVKGGFGHAFKAPTLKQISPNYVGAEGPHTFLGNGAIKPETSNSFEIGADWQVAPDWSLRATAFHTEVKQLITYRLLRTVGVRRTYQYDNVDAARIQGLETGFTWQATPTLRVSTDATLLHTRDKTTGAELSDRPRASLASRVEWRLGRFTTQLGADHTGRQLSSGQRLPAYTLYSASVGTVFAVGDGQKLNVRAGLQNLGNLRLAEQSAAFGYAEQGRRVFVNARLDF